MLLLIASLLAAPAGQDSYSASDPPPCAAVQVAGCLPGYVARIDRSGRLIYVRSEVAPPPARSSSFDATPRSYAPPRPPEQFRARAVSPSDSRGHVGLVLMPGVAAYPTFTRFKDTTAQAQIALELRGDDGGFRVRLVGAYTSFGKIGELSFKYDFFDGFFLRPFLAIGLGAASINPDPAVRATGSGSVGLDVYITRDFFLTGEIKEGLFMQGTQGPAHGLVTSDSRQTSLLAGFGFYFF
jgi:hypothetical protein